MCKTRASTPSLTYGGVLFLTLHTGSLQHLSACMLLITRNANRGYAYKKAWNRKQNYRKTYRANIACWNEIFGKYNVGSLETSCHAAQDNMKETENKQLLFMIHIDKMLFVQNVQIFLFIFKKQ